MTTSELAARPLPSIQTPPPSSELQAEPQPTLPAQSPTKPTSGDRPGPAKPFLLARLEKGDPVPPPTELPHRLTFNRCYKLMSRRGFEADLVSMASERLKNMKAVLAPPRAVGQHLALEFGLGPEADLDPIVDQFWDGIINGGPLTALQAVNVRPLDKLLTASVWKTLESLTLVVPGDFPFDGTLAAANPAGQLFLNLTHFYFGASKVAASLGDDLLKFLGNCPRLTDATFNYGDPDRIIKFTTNELLPLYNLRHFTHESPVETVPTGLLNQLALPPECACKLWVTDASGSRQFAEPWMWSEPVAQFVVTSRKKRKSCWTLFCDRIGGDSHSLCHCCASLDCPACDCSGC